jgi:uncharacterized membrane protein
MNVVLDPDLVQLVLAVIGFGAFVILLVSRYYLSHRYRRRDMARLLLIDSLLVIAGAELVADALVSFAPEGITREAALAVAFACRGALVAGGVALVATIHWERER